MSVLQQSSSPKALFFGLRCYCIFMESYSLTPLQSEIATLDAIMDGRLALPRRWFDLSMQPSATRELNALIQRGV
jgi:hypothetical protein